MNIYVFKNIAVCSVLTFSTIFSSNINMTNRTKFPAQITVIYGGCKIDRDVYVPPGQTIQIRAGWCLIAQIAASVSIPGLSIPITATPYMSSGTLYRTFELIQTGDRTFAVIRP